MTNVKASPDIKLAKMLLLQKQVETRAMLPHLYGTKHYPWSREYFESFAKLYFLSSANQVGKSSAAIRKAIHSCTEPKTWPNISAHISRGTKPTLGFYFYPSLKLARREIMHKWIPEFLPRDEMKSHPQYGWQLIDNSDMLAIRFNTGFELVFCGYSQGKGDLLALAASSPAFIVIDEEMPPELWPEVSMRIEATRGSIAMVLTPVMCYNFYKEIFEGRTKLEGAIVRTVSMYECIKFEDGTPGLYTIEDIEKRKAKLGSIAEIKKRVMGLYATPDGLTFESFRREHNVKPPEPVPDDWMYFAGIDVGAGGNSHPAAIAFVAVAPNFETGRVLKSWCGNKNEITSNTDILNKYIEIKNELIGNKNMSGVFFDWASRDFEIVAMRANVPMLQKANKDRDSGISLVNTLFKNQMLTIDETDENIMLANELESLRVDEKKRHAIDHRCDSLRYAVTKIPWNFTHLTHDKLMEVVPKVISRELSEQDLRRGHLKESKNIMDETEDELELWQALMED